MEIAKQSARGSLILFVGYLATTVLAAVTSIVVARLLGPQNFGLFSLALVFPILLQSFTHFGTRTAVTRYVSYHMSIGEADKARRYAQASVLFSLVAGGMFTLVGYFSAGWVASALLQRPLLQPYIALASLTILGQSVLLTCIAAAIGWNDMGQASLANVLQTGLKMVASPLLILLGFGIGGAVIGHVASFILAGTASAVMLYARRVKFGSKSFPLLVSDMKEMVRFGFLPFVGNLLTGLSVFYISILLAIVANNVNVGYYQAATSLVIPISLLTTATASALYPAFASLHGTKGDTSAAFRMSVKYVGYLIVPLVFFLATSATELMDLVYGTSFSPGGKFLVILSLAYTPILLGQNVIPNFFNGVGLTRFTLYTTGGGAVAIFAFAPLLAVVLGLGVPGLIYSVFISNAILVGVGLILVSMRRLGSVDFRSATAVLASGGAGLAICWVIPPLGSDLLDFMIKLVVFSAVYLTLAPVLGAVGPDDAGRISESVREVPVIGPLLVPFMTYERRLASLMKSQAAAT